MPGFFACTEPDDIGLGLIDGRASFSRTDTLTILAYTLEADSIITNLEDDNILGVMHDPVFGKTRASMFFQFRLPRNNFSLGEDLSFDSIAMYFSYSGKYYGNIESFQQLRIYELSGHLPDQDSIYSTLRVPFYPDPIGIAQIRPAPTDSVPSDTLMLAPHFRVRLSDDFGKKIIAANGTDAFASVPNFLEYFKGLHVTVEDNITETGSLFNIRMFSIFTRLSLYYRADTLPQRQDFYISDFAKRSNAFDHFGYAETHPYLQQQLTSQNPEVYGDSLLFVQSMGRLRVHIRIPHLKTLGGTGVTAVNLARLIVPVAEGFSIPEVFPEPERLVLMQKGEQGRMLHISDYLLGDDYFGGNYDAAKKQYSFNVTRYIQSVLDGRSDEDGLYLYVRNQAQNASRAVLHGPGRIDRPMRLEIVYSIFD